MQSSPSKASAIPYGNNPRAGHYLNTGDARIYYEVYSTVVLGFSDGAYTGYYLASMYPEKVRKLIAIGAGEWKQGFRTFNFTRETALAMDSLYWILNKNKLRTWL